jgi:hypothetical protein
MRFKRLPFGPFQRTGGVQWNGFFKFFVGHAWSP